MPCFSNENFICAVFYYLTKCQFLFLGTYLWGLQLLTCNILRLGKKISSLHLILEHSIQWNATQGTLKVGPASWYIGSFKTTESSCFFFVTKWNYLPLLFFFFFNSVSFLPLFCPQKRILELALQEFSRQPFLLLEGAVVRFGTWQSIKALC